MTSSGSLRGSRCLLRNCRFKVDCYMPTKTVWAGVLPSLRTACRTDMVSSYWKKYFGTRTNKDDHARNFTFICRDGRWELAPAYDITYSPAGSNGEHATSLFYNGNPGLDLVLKAGTGIRIPKSRCLEIINTVEAVCEKRLSTINKLSIA